MTTNFQGSLRTTFFFLPANLHNRYSFCQNVVQALLLQLFELQMDVRTADWLTAPLLQHLQLVPLFFFLVSARPSIHIVLGSAQ